MDVWAVFVFWFIKSVEGALDVGEIKVQVSDALKRISISGVSLNTGGKIVSVVGAIIVQFRALPPVIAAQLRISVASEG